MRRKTGRLMRRPDAHLPAVKAGTDQILTRSPTII
jgi:hypothetical protein